MPVSNKRKQKKAEKRNKKRKLVAKSKNRQRHTQMRQAREMYEQLQAKKSSLGNKSNKVPEPERSLADVKDKLRAYYRELHGVAA